MTMSVEGIPLVNPDLYADPYYYDGNLTVNGTFARLGPLPTTYPSAIGFLLLRAGLLLVQLGSIPIRDTNLILLHNLFELSISTLAYGLLGYMFAYGRDVFQLIGFRTWLASPDLNFDNAIGGWGAVVTASGIITTMVVGRMHLVGIILITFVLSALVLPIVIHWIWTPKGFMHVFDLQDIVVSYKDTGGCLIVHVIAASVAFIAVIMMGRRLMRLRDVDESSLAPSSPGTAMLGYFLFIIGLNALAMPSVMHESTHVPANFVGRIIFNNIMALGGGISTVIFLQFVIYSEAFTYWTSLRCLQGAVAGMVTISAGVDVYSPIIAMFLAICGATMSFFLIRTLFMSPWEDYCSIVAIHLLCGVFGTIMPPIFGDDDGFAFGNGTVRTVMTHLCWQGICDAVVLILVIVFFLPLLFLLYGAGFLHNASDELDHRRAQTVLSRGPERSFLQRLFRPGDFPRFIIPGNESKNQEKQRAALRDMPEVNLRYFNPRMNSKDVSKNKIEAESMQGMKIGATGSIKSTTFQAYRVDIETDIPPLINYEEQKKKELEAEKKKNSDVDTARSWQFGDTNFDPEDSERDMMASSGDHEKDIANTPYGDYIEEDSHSNYGAKARSDRSIYDPTPSIPIYHEEDELSTRSEISCRSKHTFHEGNTLVQYEISNSPRETSSTEQGNETCEIILEEEEEDEENYGDSEIFQSRSNTADVQKSLDSERSLNVFRTLQTSESCLQLQFNDSEDSTPSFCKGSSAPPPSLEDVNEVSDDRQEGTLKKVSQSEGVAVSQGSLKTPRSSKKSGRRGRASKHAGKRTRCDDKSHHHRKKRRERGTEPEIHCQEIKSLQLLDAVDHRESYNNVISELQERISHKSLSPRCRTPTFEDTFAGQVSETSIVSYAERMEERDMLSGSDGDQEQEYIEDQRSQNVTPEGQSSHEEQEDPSSEQQQYNDEKYWNETFHQVDENDEDAMQEAVYENLDKWFDD